MHMVKMIPPAAAGEAPDHPVAGPVCCGAGKRRIAGRPQDLPGGGARRRDHLRNARAGIEKRRQHLDVVVAIVDTHGGKEAEGLLRQLEVIPGRASGPAPSRRATPGCAGEMDLDAVLRRRPALALVDEFAHINAPGSLHPRRFMEVCELLQAGIDVYATLHMHQVESLNAIVARITRVQRGEVIPDSLVYRADEIEVIEAAPWDIARRLRRGKLALWFAA
ncbi:MAG: hypothetical protein U1E33_08775 [Rhodospirillales bacterium]